METGATGETSRALADLSRILDGGDQARAPAAARAAEDIDGQWRAVDLAVAPGGRPSSGLGGGTVAEDRARNR